MQTIIIGLNDKSTYISDYPTRHLAEWAGGATEVPYIRIIQSQNHWDVSLKLNEGEPKTCHIYVSDDPDEQSFKITRFEGKNLSFFTLSL